MLLPTHCFALMLLVLADAADATSRLWQPRISRYDHLPAISSNHSLTRRALDELENPSPIAARSIDKRLLIRTLSLMQRWPNNEIRYCFATKDDKLALFSNLKTAINRWWEMGLDQANFKWTEVDENECESRRSSILLIKRQPPGTGAHVTTTGFVPADPSVGNFGPLMELDDGEWGGYDTKVGSFAHEIGHAWGLFHEHQNPNFWRPEDGFDQGNQGKVFGNDNFHCENIIGYETKLAAAQAQFGQENGKRICKNGVWARLMEFEAQAFLPMSTDEVYSLGGHEFGDVDWSSIMLYSSLQASSNGQPVITVPGGPLIHQNTMPTSLDVFGINLLYDTPMQFQQPFLNQASSAQFNSFQNLYRESRGEGGC